jgi:predicted transcriptional regulator
VRRRHWQVLGALAQGPCSRAEIAEAMLPLWVAAAVTQTDVVDDLVRRDWADTDGSTYRLTTVGVVAVERIQQLLEAVHAQALHGLAPAEVAAALDVLDRVAGNLSR